MSQNEEIMRILGNLEGGVKQLLDANKSHHDRMNRIDENVEELDNRLRNVERKQYTIFVLATAIWAAFLAWWSK